MAAIRSIELKTELPGPRSREILTRLEAVVSSALAVYLPVVAAEAHGATLTDVDGNTFIDFAGGVGCLNVGHTHAHVTDAVQEQAARFLHTDFTIVPYEVYVEVAERLVALAPFDGPAKAAFFNAGTEAVENAVKFARAYTGRPAVIGFEGAFHGRTLLSLTLTSKTHPYKAGLGPFAPEVYRVPFPYEYRGVDARDALDALQRALITPVALAAAAAVLDVIEDEGLVDRAARIGDVIRGRMQEWQRRHPQIGDVRGLGAMLAIELVDDPESKRPAPELASAVAEAAAERGLLLLKAGTHSNCIRVLCPLVISDSELEEALGVWGEALEAVLA